MTVGVYVIEFSTGVVKVGRAENIEMRIKNHYANAHAYGIEVVRHETIAHSQYYAIEIAVLNELYENHLPRTRNGEYFTNLAFTDALECIRRIASSITSDGTTSRSHHRRQRTGSRTTTREDIESFMWQRIAQMQADGHDVFRARDVIEVARKYEWSRATVYHVLNEWCSRNEIEKIRVEDGFVYRVQQT